MVDYDLTDIPAAYDRARDHGQEVLDLWMSTIAAHVAPGASIMRILDLGCGTGRFSEALASGFDADVIGVDPSMKMLRLALGKRRDDRVHYERGRAEHLPLAPESVDLVFMSMSYHHFSDAAAAARECHRVLRARGSVFVRTGTREQIDRYPYVPFFAASRPLLEQVLPAGADLRATFDAAALNMVAAQTITQTIASDWTVYAQKLAVGGDSVLARLSLRDFDDGIAAVRRHAIASGPEPVVEPIDLFVFRKAPPI